MTQNTPLWRRPGVILNAAFFVQASAAAGIFARIPDVQDRLSLGEGALGMVLMGLSIGSFLMFPLCAWLIDRIGTKATLTIPILCNATGALGFTLAPNAITAFAALMIVGASFSISNIAMNLEADRYEFHTGKKIMSRAHGLWSLGFLLSATLAVGARAIGMAPSVQLGLSLPVVALAALYLHLVLHSHPQRNAKEKPSRIAFPLPSRGVAAIAAFGFAGVASHGAATNWSVLYLEDEFGVAGAIAALAIPLFTLALFVGRLFGDRVIAGLGIQNVATGCLVLSLIGALLTLIAQSALTAFAGVAFLGLGTALTYPLMVTAAAKLTDRPASENISALTMTLSSSILIVPPIIGFVAEAFGLRLGLAVLLPAILLSFTFVTSLTKDKTCASDAP